MRQGLADTEPDFVVALERERLAHRRPPGRPRLGDILLAAGEISHRELNHALERMPTSGRRIGEELVACGAVSAEQLGRAIRLQRRLLMSALLAAVMSPAHAVDPRALMSVTANVIDSVGIRAVYQAQTLEITPQDLQRGSVEVPAASRFEIRNRGACLFEFRSTRDLFHSVAVITGEAAAVEFDASGGTLLQKVPRDAGGAFALTYRFTLKPGVRAGTHEWPLAVTVLPL